MRIYEELFIVDPGTAEEQIDQVVGQIEGIVKDGGGTVDKVEKWGVRKLAYRVKKREEGYYVLVQFSTTAGSTVKEIERRLRVDEIVLKYLTVRVDEDLKRAEKRKQKREQRAARKPKPPAPPPAAPAAPSKPDSASVPGAPAQADAKSNDEGGQQ
jgi:small subunit ribosomal protein S6